MPKIKSTSLGKFPNPLHSNKTDGASVDHDPKSYITHWHAAPHGQRIYRRTKRACEVFKVAEEISSSDVALSRPGTYSNGKNDPQKTTEIPKPGSADDK